MFTFPWKFRTRRERQTDIARFVDAASDCDYQIETRGIGTQVVESLVWLRANAKHEEWCLLADYQRAIRRDEPESGRVETEGHADYHIGKYSFRGCSLQAMNP